MPELYQEQGGLIIDRYMQPSASLARTAELIGSDAWQAQLNRTPLEIAHSFNPGNEMMAERLFERMSEKEGKFVGVVATIGDTAIGYAWAAEDQSASEAKLKVKRLMGLYAEPYVWIAQINVLPEHQGRGVGSAMLHDVLRPFANHQRPTAYVFEENGRSLEWFENRGFAARPKKPDPKYNYFGEGADPVMQFRLEAHSVLSVRERVVNDMTQRRVVNHYSPDSARRSTS